MYAVMISMLTNGKHLNFKVYLDGYAIDALQSNSHKRFLIMVLITTIWSEKSNMYYTRMCIESYRLKNRKNRHNETH